MSAPGFILIAGATGWRICAPGTPTIEVPMPPNASANDVVGAVASALRESGYGGEGVLLAIPSQWCLCARVSTKDLPSKNRQKTMVYRLEDKLPVAAEDVVADFIPFDADDAETLGIAVQKALLAPVVEALESSGVAVAAICPLALLVLQHLAGAARDGAFDAVLCNAGDSRNLLELFILRESRPITWCTLPADPKDVVMHLAVELGDRAVTIAAINTSSEIEQALSNRPGTRVINLDADPLAGAVTIAGSILSGKTVPWLNFRRDDLAVREPFRQIRTPLRFALAAVAVFLVCLCGAMLWRAKQYEKLAERLSTEQHAVFQRAYPNIAVPVDVHSRLVAEARGLTALSGGTSAAAPRECGLVTLRDVLTHLPAPDTLRYRVLEVRLDQGRFTIEGQAPTHGDADSIAASLRNGGLFVVEPPRTEQLGNVSGSDANAEKSEGIAFTIMGVAAAVPGRAK